MATSMTTDTVSVPVGITIGENGQVICDPDTVHVRKGGKVQFKCAYPYAIVFADTTSPADDHTYTSGPGDKPVQIRLDAGQRAYKYAAIVVIDGNSAPLAVDPQVVVD